MKKKTLALLLSLALVLVGIVGGTMAWLTDKTGEVKNTFTTSDIDITLEETDTDPNTEGEQHNYKMVPGYTITKDPKVTVVVGSEKCYLFVKVEKSANFDTFLTYEMAEGWTALTDANNDGVADDGVYYRVVDTNGMGTAYSVLKGDKVTVLDTVTKANMDTAKDNAPTLTFTAYASQYYKNNTASTGDTNGTPFTVAEAWTNVSGT